MIIRALVQLWRRLTAKRYEFMSPDWIRDNSGRTYDDNPKAQTKRPIDGSIV